MNKIIVIALIVLFHLGIYGANTGDGYKNIKWGASKERVLKVLDTDKYTTIKESKDLLVFEVESKDTLEIYFYQNKAYKARYIIKRERFSFSEDNNICPEEKLSMEILKTLKKKYGKKYKKGKYEKRDESGISIENPYFTYKWSGKKTVIEYRVPVLLCGMQNMHVIYKSVKITKKIRTDQEAKKNRKNRAMEDRIKKRSNKITDNL